VRLMGDVKILAALAATGLQRLQVRKLGKKAA
jgi:hypothetical protein